MAFDESGVRLWKKEACSEQKSFFGNLKKNGNDHGLKSPWENVSKEKADRRYSNLARKIGYGFFGPPCKRKTESDFGYDKNKTFAVETCIEIIKSSKIDFSRDVFLAFVMVLSRDEDGVRVTLPILRFFNETENKNEFVDGEGKRHAGWDGLLNFLTSSDRDYCFPENGIYRDDDENIKYLFRDPSAPVVILGKNSFAQEVPELLQPDDMELTETHFSRFCSSVAFFFNRFCDEKTLWKWIEEAGDEVLEEVKKSLSPENRLYWEENWEDRFKNPETKARALKCLGGLEAEVFVRRMREAEIRNLAFREKGLVNINDLIDISPRRYQEIYTELFEKKKLEKKSGKISEKSEYEKLCQHLNTAEAKELKNLSKDNQLNLKFEFEKKEEQKIIFELLKEENLCRSPSDFENIEINDVVISKNINKSHQLGSLCRALNVTCKKRNPKLINIGLQLINLQKFRKIEDMINAIEFAAAYIGKPAREQEADYQTQLKEVGDKEVNQRFQIPMGTKRKDHFLQNQINKMYEISNLSEMNRYFNDSQSECLEVSRKYEWGFDRNSGAAYHYLKHGESKDLTPKEYFEMIQDVFEASRHPVENKKIKTIESTTQEGDAVCKILTMDDRVVILYQRKAMTPEGALEPINILATFYIDNKKKLENLVELPDENAINELTKKCLVTFFLLILLFYFLIIYFSIFYEYFSLQFLLD